MSPSRAAPEMTTEPDLDILASRLEELSTFGDRLWDAAPDVGRARARVARVTECTSVLLAAVEPAMQLQVVIDDAVDQMLDGADLDVDRLRADVARATASTEAQEAVARAMSTRSVTTRQDVETAERQHADLALAVLHVTVTALKTVARPLIAAADAAPVSTADAGRS